MIYTTIPTTQKYVKGSFGDGGNVMIATGESADLSFRHILGWLKLQLSGYCSVKSITLRGPNSREFLAGGKVLLYPDTGLVVSAEKSASLTLDCGDGVQLTETPTDFYIALIPQTFENGLDIEVTTTTGSQEKISVSHSVSVARNHIVPIKSRALVSQSIRIIYTTSDNKPVNLNTSASTVQLLHTYNNGIGTITFDDVTAEISSALFKGNKNLISVIIPNGVVSIGESAFSGCTSLASITIPDSVTSIGEVAFSGCTSLKSVTIPDSVTAIGESAFSGCTSLASITIPDSVTSIGESAFSGCTSLASITIPDSVTSIGEVAFSGCTSLKSVTIPDSVTAIGGAAFSGCTSLTSVTIGKRVKSIGEWAFSGCTSLASIAIPDNVKRIFRGAFQGCTGLTSVTIGNGIKSIVAQTFYGCTSLKSVTIPDSVTEIGDLAFSGCTSLTSVHITDITAWCSIKFSGKGENLLYYAHNLYLNGKLVTDLVIPDSFTYINYAFCGCISLTSVTIPNSVNSIGSSAFSGCTSLASVTIPDSVTSIGDWAFNDCTSLRSVTIPDSVTEIGGAVFYSCTGLTSVTIGKGVTEISNSAFEGCTSLTSITIPDSVTSIGDWAFNDCTGLTRFYGKFASDDNRCLIVDGVLKNFAPAGLTEYTVPDNVTSIGKSAFYCCTGLTSVTIGKGVTEISNSAFEGCTSLTSIYCKPTTPPTLDIFVFYNIASDAKIYVPRASLNIYKTDTCWGEYSSYIYGYDF